MAEYFQKGILKQKLIDMGYSPMENGEYFRMRALYRGGNTQSSLSVHCKNGYFYDFGTCSGGSFVDLIKLTTGKVSKADIEKFLKESGDGLYKDDAKERIKMEKIYKDDCLERLLPNYEYFINKKIDEDILKKYKCGFCSSGDLNRRVVFPIYNKNGEIHGFTGRHIVWNKDSQFPKWKHAGKTMDWIYPIYVKDKNDMPFFEEVKKRKEIILVESIGDSLALSQNGYFNNMVCFGLNLSPKRLAFIAGMDLKKVIIATNNDANKETNTGAISAIKIYLKLVSSYVDVDKLTISLPTSKDFSDMQFEDKDFDDWYKKKVIGFKKEESLKYILNILKKARNSDDKKTFTKKEFEKIDVIEALC